MSSISIVIPLYNEDKIVRRELRILKEGLSRVSLEDYEILLIENGSTDNTKQIVDKLAKDDRKIRAFHLKKASYGNAIKKGIGEAKYENIFQFSIDFKSVDFIKKALELSPSFDIVVGSKLLPKSKDTRPLSRRLMTKLVAVLIKMLGYEGTDTHGLKYYKRKEISSIIDKIEVKHHFFDTELILRAQKLGVKITEVPVVVEEIRRARFPLLIRAKQVFTELVQLMLVSKTFPKNKVSYYFTADDYGYNKSSENYTNKLFKQGKIKKISVLPNFLYERKNQNTFIKGRKITLHVNLIEKKPITDSKKIKSLVSSNGNFYTRYVFLARLLLGLVDRKDIRKEIKAQYDYLLSLGAKITEIDSHDHMHAFSPIAEEVKRFAKRKKLKIRLYGDLKPYTLRGKLYYIVMKILALTTHFVYLGKLELPPTWKSSGKKICFMSLETRLPSSDYVVVTHPGLKFDKNEDYKKYF